MPYVESLKRFTTQIQAEKKAVRAKILHLRQALAPEKKHTLSVAIQNFVLRDPVWQNAKSAALYCAINNEAETDMLIDAAWHAKKHVFLPRCLPEKKSAAGGYMDFILCNNRDDLQRGIFHTLEPAACCQTRASAEQHFLPDLIIIPAVALRPDGVRLGYGGGYYDRFFAESSWQNIPRIALIFSFQLCAFPAEQTPLHNDIAVSAFATEKGLVWL